MASIAMNRYIGRYPSPPWICYFCKENILLRENSGKGLVIHHINENDADHRFDNLAPSHHNCHSSNHRIGKKAHPNTLIAISKSIKEINSRKIDCPNGCGKQSNPGAIASHSRSWNCPEFNG